MKKTLILAACLGVLTASIAHATPITVTYSADNLVYDWYLLDGGAPTALPLGGNWAAWNNSDVTQLNLAPGHAYQLVWHASNDGPSNSYNPAGFMAMIEGLGTTLKTGDLGWQYALTGFTTQWTYPGGVASYAHPEADFNTLTWQDVTSYGFPSTAQVWSDFNNNLQNLEAAGAQMVWSGTNYAGLQDQELYIRTSFSTPVPVPAPILLLGSGLATLAAARRRKSVQQA